MKKQHQWNLFIAGVVLAMSFARVGAASVISDQGKARLRELLPVAVELIKTHAPFVQAMGLGSSGAPSPRLDTEAALPVHRIDSAKIASARTLANAAEPTEEFYIPLCAGERCPLLMTVRQTADDQFELVSVGMEQTAVDLAEARQTFRSDAETKDRQMVAVEYPESHVTFYSSRATTDGRGTLDDRLVPMGRNQSAKLGQWMVSAPLAERGARSTSTLALLRQLHGQVESLKR